MKSDLVFDDLNLNPIKLDSIFSSFNKTGDITVEIKLCVK